MGHRLDMTIEGLVGMMIAVMMIGATMIGVMMTAVTTTAATMIVVIEWGRKYAKTFFEKKIQFDGRRRR